MDSVQNCDTSIDIRDTKTRTNSCLTFHLLADKNTNMAVVEISTLGVTLLKLTFVRSRNIFFSCKQFRKYVTSAKFS
jgi:hypothetical protein